jgi:hypothetical protein
MKTRSTKPKSKRNTKYNRKTHRKPKKAVHKKRRSRGRKYGGDSQLSAMGNLKNFFGRGSCGDKTDNYDKIVCEIGKIMRNIKKLKEDVQFMKFENKVNENVVNGEIDGPSRKLYEETLNKITHLIKYFDQYQGTHSDVNDKRMASTTLEELLYLHTQFDVLTDAAKFKDYMNIPMYNFITIIMPIMGSIQSELDDKSKTCTAFPHPVGKRVDNPPLYS